MSNDVIDVVARALLPSGAAIEEAKPVAVICKEKGCTRRAARSDGRCSRHSGLRLTLAEKKNLARRIVEEDQAKYAQLHWRAAVIAAGKGDATPAQWALLHGKTVEPLEKKGDSGVTVNVGVVLPGLREAY